MEIIFGGRFQPFHNGHLYTLKYLARRFNKVILAVVCVPQILPEEELLKSTLSPARNPLTYLEREEGIRKTLITAGLNNVAVVPIMPYLSSGIFMDINNTVLPTKRRWFVALKSVEEKEQIEQYYNKLGDEVLAEPLPESMLSYSSRKIRENIVKGRKWEDTVPIDVVNTLKQLGIEKRLTKLHETYGGEVYSSKATRIVDFEKILKNKLLKA